MHALPCEGGQVAATLSAAACYPETDRNACQIAPTGEEHERMRPTAQSRRLQPPPHHVNAEIAAACAATSESGVAAYVITAALPNVATGSSPAGIGQERGWQWPARTGRSQHHLPPPPPAPTPPATTTTVVATATSFADAAAANRRHITPNVFAWLSERQGWHA